MATYYVDNTGTWAVAQTGADHTGNEWQGPAGLQEAFDTVAANPDTVYVYGEADLARLVTLTVNDTTSWAAGDNLRNNNLGGGTPGDDWSSAVLYEVVDGNTVIIEMQPGETIDDIDISDGIDNVTQTDQETCSAKAADGIQGDGADGAYQTEIFFIGVNSSWAVDGTMAILDGGSATTKATQCIYLDGIDYYQFRNFRFTDADTDGLLCNSSGTQDYHIFTNCDFDNNGNYGAGIEELEYAQFYGCRFYLNGSHGVHAPWFSSRFFGCTFDNNTGSGMNSGAGTDRIIVEDCIAANNTAEYGLKFDVECSAIHCVVDSQTTGIRHSGAIAGLTLMCRLTNCGRGIINSGSHKYAWNLFFNNSVEDVNGGTKVDHYGSDSNEYDPDVDDGYVNQGNEDYNLKDSRTFNGQTQYLDLRLGS